MKVDQRRRGAAAKTLSCRHSRKWEHAAEAGAMVGGGIHCVCRDQIPVLGPGRRWHLVVLVRSANERGGAGERSPRRTPGAGPASLCCEVLWTRGGQTMAKAEGRQSLGRGPRAQWQAATAADDGWAVLRGRVRATHRFWHQMPPGNSHLQSARRQPPSAAWQPPMTVVILRPEELYQTGHVLSRSARPPP